MGQTLIGRPVSQNQGFATLNTASSPFTGDLSQFQGYTTPQPTQQQQPVSQLAGTLPKTYVPTSLGFRNYGSNMINRGMRMQL